MSTPQPIIEPIARELIKGELTSEKLLRRTSNGANDIYILTANDAPYTMEEIGRLRELSFREAGGGTGLDKDIDEDDTAEDGYNQLIVWDPTSEEIVGGYRYIVSNSSDTKHLSTEHYFTFTETFRNDYLPYTIELGRSFVQPLYQGRKGNSKGIYALDNLWDGIGALAAKNPHIKYFFGKVTMYDTYNKDARNKLFYFMKKYFEDKKSLLIPINPVMVDCDEAKLTELFTGENYREDYKILTREIRSHGEHIPPLINSYMNLSPSMIVFDTVLNPDFGGVKETGILITIKDIHQDKIDRYIRC